MSKRADYWRKYSLIFLAIVSTSLVIAWHAGASELLDSTVSRKALEDLESRARLHLLNSNRVSVTEAAMDIKRLFGWQKVFPLSVETVTDDATRILVVDGFSYEPGMKLRDILESLRRANQEHIHWLQSDNFVVMLDCPPDDTKTFLSRNISVKIHEVSLWFALHAFAKALLEASPELDYMGFTFPDLDTTGNARAFMLQEGEVTLCMAETPAREVLHEILKQSPVPLFYSYSHRLEDDKKIRSLLQLFPNVVTDEDRAAYGERPAFRPREQFLYWLEAHIVRRDSVYVAPPE